MKLLDALVYCKKEDVYVSDFEEFDIFNIDIDKNLYDPSKSPIKICIVHEYSVDDHTGYTKYLLLNDKPFALITSSHEDQVDVEIIDSSVYKDTLSFLIKFVSPIKEDNVEFLNVDINIIQKFDSTYNVYGNNLLYYCYDNNKFFKIINYWQDKDELEKDIDRSYDDMYLYKYFEVTLDDGRTITVDYHNIASVIGDNATLANDIVNGNIDVPNAKYIMSPIYNLVNSPSYIDGMIPLLDLQLDKRCSSKVIAHKVITLSMYLLIKYGVYTDLYNNSFLSDEYHPCSNYNELYDVMFKYIRNKENLECITDSVEYESYHDATRKIFDNMDEYEDKPHSVIIEDFIKLTIDYFMG